MSGAPSGPIPAMRLPGKLHGSRLPGSGDYGKLLLGLFHHPLQDLTQEQQRAERELAPVELEICQRFPVQRDHGIGAEALAYDEVDECILFLRGAPGKTADGAAQVTQKELIRSLIGEPVRTHLQHAVA
jgi:hypothetical protein